MEGFLSTSKSIDIGYTYAKGSMLKITIPNNLEKEIIKNGFVEMKDFSYYYE